MYKLSDILELIEAIKGRDNSNILTKKQKNILKRSYDLYVKKMSIEAAPDAFIRQGIDTYSLVFDYIYNNRFLTKGLDFETRKKIQLFKTLLSYKNKNVTLKELYRSVYKGLFDEKTIEEKFNDPVERERFFCELNGCILEEKVANIDMANFDINDLGSIKIDIGDKDNPLLFVSSINTSIIPNIDVSESKNVTFLTFSDLHLDTGCFSVDLETGQAVLNQAKLEENLLAFVNFKNKIIRDLEKRGIKVAGVVFTGDIFEAFTISSSDENKPTNFVKSNRTDLMNGIIRFQNDNDSVLTMPSSISDEGHFVAYIAGNHDMTLGKNVFDQMMKVFREDAINLGNGSARIKIGDDFVSFVHHDSLDWGMSGWDLRFTTRKARNISTFHFNEFFKICQKYYDEAVTDKDSFSINDLFKAVSKKLKRENPELYKYFLPYTIPNYIQNSSDKKSTIGEDESRRRINSTIPFFANFMYIDKNPPYDLKKRTGNFFFPDSMRYHKFISGGTKVQEALLREKMVISQFGRDDNYRSALTVLGHFHMHLVGPKNGSTRMSYGERSGGLRRFPVVVDEGASHYIEENGEKHFDFSATQYNLRIKNGKISRIGVVPLVASLKKISVDGRIDFEGDLDRKPETSYLPSKKH